MFSTRLHVAATALVLLGLGACSSEPAVSVDEATSARAAAAVVTRVSEDTRLAAVLVRADWCSSCKIIEPKLALVRAANSIDGLQHVTLDYTDRKKDAFFATADAAGIGPAIRAHLGDDVTTGIVLLVDLGDMKIVGDLRKELSDAELAAAMAEAASSA